MEIDDIFLVINETLRGLNIIVNNVVKQNFIPVPDVKEEDCVYVLFVEEIARMVSFPNSNDYDYMTVASISIDFGLNLSFCARRQYI